MGYSLRSRAPSRCVAADLQPVIRSLRPRHHPPRRRKALWIGSYGEVVQVAALPEPCFADCRLRRRRRLRWGRARPSHDRASARRLEGPHKGRGLLSSRGSARTVAMPNPSGSRRRWLRARDSRHPSVTPDVGGRHAPGRTAYPSRLRRANGSHHVSRERSPRGVSA